MAEVIVCSDCGTDVAYGRLTCPECGELLASVSSGFRRAGGVGSTVPVDDESPRDDRSPFDDEAPLAADTATDQALARAASVPFDPDDGLPMHNHASPTADPYPDAMVDWPSASLDPGPAEADPSAPEPVIEGPVDATPAPADPPAAELSGATASAAPDMLEFDDAALPWLDQPETPSDVEPSWTSTPGAYVPPVVPLAGGTGAGGAVGIAAMSGAVAAPARAWGPMRGNGTSASSVVDGSSTGASAATSADAVGPDGPATNRALDAVKVTEFIGWLAIAGSALALVGFLLPWSTSVIGASGVSYLDRWGFAGPGHILIAIGLAGVLVAAVLRDRVPLWLGIGMPGLGLGALVIGLAWPYLVGPLGGQIGVVTVTLGSVLLVVAGLLAIILEQRARHAEDGPTV